MIRPHYVPLFQSACHSEKLADLKDRGACWFWALLLTHCDAWGRATARPRVLFSKVWAMYGTEADVELYLDDLERVGLIRRYEVKGEWFLCIPDWEDKAGRVGQASRRAESEIPEPPEIKATNGKAPRTPRKVSQDVTRASPRARGRAATATATATARLGSEEGDTGEEPEKLSPKVEVEAWAKVFAEFPSLDTPEAHTAFRRVLSTRKARHDKPWGDDRLRTKLRQFEPHGPHAFAESVERSVGDGYAGIFPPKGASSGATGKPTGLAAVESLFRKQQAQ